MAASKMIMGRLFAVRVLWLVLLLALSGCDLAARVEGVGDPEPSPTRSDPLRATNDALSTVEPTGTPIPAAETGVAISATPAPVTPTASPTPAPRLFRLTSGGCCTLPFWAPDSSAVYFIDRPTPGSPVGVWGVPLAQPDRPPHLVTQEIASFSRDGEFLIEAGGAVTVIERVADGIRWMVNTDGETPAISPDQRRIAWETRNRSLPFEEQVAEIWVANIDGTNAEQVYTLPRGDVRGWLSDDDLLLTGRDAPDAEEERLFTLSVSDGATTDLVTSDRMSGEALSPGGRWVAFYIAQSIDPARNGFWIAGTDGRAPRQLPDEFFGAYQWRDADHLLVIPLRPEAQYHELWEIDAATGEARQLTTGNAFPIKIANGDWIVSPDGRNVAFVESSDKNIWVLDLP